jgi:hypothetical protein
LKGVLNIKRNYSRTGGSDSGLKTKIIRREKKMGRGSEGKDAAEIGQKQNVIRK